MSKNEQLVTFDEARVDAIFACLNQGARPGAGVGIAINGKAVYRKGFGLANMSLPLLLSPTMRIRIGSVTKHFAAFAFMLLCEDGLADIDDSIGKYLPELHPVTHKVTLRQIMGNNSGLRDATDLINQFNGAENGRVTTSDTMEFYREFTEINCAPGATNIYNNGGWIVLEAIIERIAGRPLEEVLWERVFKPVGMYDTLLHRWEAEYIPNRAGTHALNAAGKWEWCELCGGVDYGAAGAIFSTVDDMLRWMAHMDAPTVGSVETWKLMQTPQRISGISTAYSLGLETPPLYRGVRLIHHSGGGYGSTTWMVKVPDVGLDVIVMCNSQSNGGLDSNAVGLLERVLEACLPSLAPDEEQQYQGPFPQGVFRSPRTGRAVQCLRTDTGWYRPGELTCVAAVDGTLVPFFQDSEAVLRPWNAYYPSLSLTPVGPKESPAALRLVEFGDHDELVRVDATEGSDRALTLITGRYYSDEARAEAEIVQTDLGPRLKTKGKFGSAEHSLEYLADGVWRNRLLNRWTNPRCGFLLFDADYGAFGFYNLITRNVRFRRTG